MENPLEKGSVTALIDGAREDEAAAFQELWQLYYEPLVGMARRKLRNASLRDSDQEDIALSAFRVFCVKAREGRFPDLHDRDGLWNLLKKITRNKATDQIRREIANPVVGESRLPGSDSTPNGLARIPEPTPEEGEDAIECVRRLLGVLDAKHRQIVELKFKGYANKKIAAIIGVNERTVERRLHRIRRAYKQKVELDEAS